MQKTGYKAIGNYPRTGRLSELSLEVSQEIMQVVDDNPFITIVHGLNLKKPCIKVTIYQLLLVESLS